MKKVDFWGGGYHIYILYKFELEAQASPTHKLQDHERSY